MTEISRPWDGVTVGDAGPYSASEWQRMFARAMGHGGQLANASILRGSYTTDPFNPLRVTPTSPASAGVLVSAGSALVQGAFYENDADVTLAVSPNASGNGRIDTIILRSDIVNQEVRLAVKEGTPAASPARPTLTQSATVWEVPLADLTLASGFTTVTAGLIANYPLPANSPDVVIMQGVLNNSGAELVTGDVVVWDTTGVSRVTTSTDIYKASGRVAGVWQGLTANGAEGAIQTEGIGYVRVNAAVAAIGQALSLSATAKQASPSSHATFAIALETTSGAGLCLAYIKANKEYVREKLMAGLALSPAQSIPNNTLTLVTNWVDGAFKSIAGMHSNGTNPARLFLPRYGLWMVSGYLNMSGASGTYRYGALVRSGGGNEWESRMPVLGNPSFSVPFWVTSDNDYVTVNVQQDSGGAINLNTSSYFRAYFVGDIL